MFRYTNETIFFRERNVSSRYRIECVYLDSLAEIPTFCQRAIYVGFSALRVFESPRDTFSIDTLDSGSDRVEPILSIRFGLLPELEKYCVSAELPYLTNSRRRRRETMHSHDVS